MSQRPPASRPASRSPPDTQRITLAPAQPRDDLQQVGREGGRQQAEFELRRGEPSPQLPRAGNTTPSGENWRGAPLRDLGVHSILNPTEPETSSASVRRYSGPPPDSPSSVGPGSHFAPSPSTSTTHTFSSHQSSVAQATGESYGGSGTLPRVRKILTPRSPSSRSISSTARPRGTIDAQRSPFLPSRGRQYTAEPGHSSDVPPMPTPPGHQSRDYGFPSAASTPTIDRRTSTGAMQAPGHGAPSQSASPSILASSQLPASSQTSPASFPYQKGPGGPPQATTPYYPGSSFGQAIQHGGGMQFQGAAAAPEEPGPYSQAPPQAQGGTPLNSSSAGSSRQTSASDPIQVLTITTSQGQYTVPVDVHQASRLADEKRARNAGASARFRQRRKEKEKEAQDTIDKLNGQARDLERRMREMEEERNFYRAERDRYRDVLYRTPDLRHYALQAPPSPNPMRPASSFPAPMQQQHQPPQMGSGHSPRMGYAPPPDSSQERAPRRRRVDDQGDFANVPYSHSPSSSLPPVHTPGYAQAPGPGPAREQQPPNLPPLRLEAAPSRTSGQGSVTPGARSEEPLPPYPGYSRSPYERGWPGDGARR